MPFRATSLGGAGLIVAAMFSRFAARPEFSPLFYGFTIAVALFCVLEPSLMSVLADVEEQAGRAGPSLFRIVVRPIVYLFGFLLFLLFDQTYSQFIYSQF